MALLFCDSFDYYDNPGLKWQNAGGATNSLDGTRSRTGVGCCLISGVIAPSLALPARTEYIIGVAFNIQGLGGGFTNGRPIQLNGSSGGRIVVQINDDGSVSVADAGVTRATSSGGLVQAGVYSYIELKVVATAPVGEYNASVRVNGVQVIPPTDCATALNSPINVFTMTGRSGGLQAAVDDVYVCDALGGVNNDFLGAIRVYPTLPNADATPLQWTPSIAGPHFSLVDANPENGGTTYVSSATVGQVDQYSFPLPAGVTPPVTILGAQVSLLAEIDSAGARSIAPQVNGNVAGGTALSTSYHMVLQPYDTNPGTGLQWQSADFPVTAGPVVTA
jgi:hypothetical protein